MKLWMALSMLLAFALILNSEVYAHPGNTASDGCHYCRTNCDRWGVAWNQRHCHGGGSIEEAPVVVKTYPTSTPKPYIPLATKIPVRLPTSKPTNIPTQVPTSTPTVVITETPIATVTNSPTLEPTNKPEVLGATEKNKEDSDFGGGTVFGILLSGLGFGGYKLIKKFK